MKPPYRLWRQHNIIAYKGFDKNFRCRDFQFEVGKTYHHDGELKICDSGFHFCKNPLEVFAYYPPADSRYALVEVSGNIVEGDDKCCTDELTVMKELSLSDLVAAISEKNATNLGDCSVATNSGDYSAATNSGDCSVATNSGDYSAATNSGDCSVATNSGYRSVATNSGYRSVATNSGDYSAATNSGDCSVAIVTGYQSIAVATGKDGNAKGALDCWIVLTDWQDGNIIDVQSFKVDGVNIKPDVFYQLIDGKPVAQSDNNIAD